jgi:DNA polymerase-3 subunit epsilon
MPLAPCYALVDVETTGLSPRHHRVIEIAVIRVQRDGDAWLASEWRSLVDPGVPIPAVISRLTGITAAQCAGAPPFAALAAEVRARLDGALFVAHQARFDYGFVRAELARAGHALSARTLCTVRLSRLLEPQAADHTLDGLLARHGLTAPERHRALGDAHALWALVQALAARHGERTLRLAASRLLRHPGLPSHLPAQALDDAPEGPGVYAMLGASGQPLYVGRSSHLRRRLASHFSADPTGERATRLAAETHRLEWQRTGGELGARLLEAQWIRERQPSHNIAQRRVWPWFARLPGDAGRFELLRGDRLAPGEESGLYGPFGSRAAARAALTEAASRACLCLATLGLERRGPGEPCFRHQLGRCAGACVGRVSAASQWQGLAEALADRRVPPWPAAGPITLHEDDPAGAAQWHVLSHWRHLGSADDPQSALQLAGRTPQGALDPGVYRLLRRLLAADPR